MVFLAYQACLDLKENEQPLDELAVRERMAYLDFLGPQVLLV